MSRLDPAEHLAALMRSQIANLRRNASAKSPARAALQKDTTAASARPDPAALAAARIRSISPDDPERKRKALRIFLECVFQSEFGSESVRDAGFSRMVDYVQQQFSADPALAEAASQAADALLGRADR